MRWPILCAVLMMILGANRVEGEPAPAGGAWVQTVESFAKALSESDPAALVPSLAESVQIEAFDAKGGDAVRLLARTRKGLLVGRYAYGSVPATLAADIGQDIAKAAVPDEIKRKLTPADAAGMKRANEAGAQWVAGALGAQANDQVGVVLFWCAREPGGDSELVFVLVKGESEGTSRIKSIAFGNPERRTR